MLLYIKKMNEKCATEIFSWRYVKPYDFYNSDLNSDSLQEFLENPYFAVSDQDDELFGFFCIGKSAQVPIGERFGAYNEDMLDIGFGMKPELTGKGNGFEFCSFIFGYIQESYKTTNLRLTVAAFNERAIHLYKNLGFTKVMEFHTDSTEFITMVKE